ncbi:hypothetical protein [Alteromonas sp. H39]|uniref:hypothetical protein n=1 Tax=Alteromonas sp. H39 TaxID=3389876 RepID=UPI0039DFF58C
MQGQIRPFFYRAMCLFTTAFLSTVAMSASAADYNVQEHSVLLGKSYELRSLGGFRLKDGTSGTSRAAYGTGKIAVSDDDKMLFLAGHAHHFSVGAFDIEDKLSFGKISTLPIAPVAQPFVKVKPQFVFQDSATQITGLELNEGSLLVTVDKYYDAARTNKENLMFFADASNLNDTAQIGFYTLAARSHATGWMTKIPAPLSQTLGADYLVGSASNLPINSRSSIGPTLFTWTPPTVKALPPLGRRISTVKKLGYSLDNPIVDDRYNETRENDIWTELSTAEIGFISPDQTSYIVIGQSGGHNSGIGYKITQDNGNVCGGPCAYEHDDYYNYYWIYDIDDIIAVQNGNKLPHEVLPAFYGELPTFGHQNTITGADYNPVSKRLYLTLSSIDTSQSDYEKNPIIVAYEFVE